MKVTLGGRVRGSGHHFSCSLLLHPHHSAPPHTTPRTYVSQVGVGTSTLQVDLVQQAGFTHIVNTDYSPVCIKQMEEAHADLAPSLTYRSDFCVHAVAGGHSTLLRHPPHKADLLSHFQVVRLERHARVQRWGILRCCLDCVSCVCERCGRNVVPP